MEPPAASYNPLLPPTQNLPGWVSGAHLLRVLFVDGAIHPDGGAQPVDPPVLLQAVEHSGQGSPTKVCRAGGDNLADALGGHAVLVGRLQAQLFQDRAGY